MMKRRYTIELIISFLLITAKAFSYDFESDDNSIVKGGEYIIK